MRQSIGRYGIVVHGREKLKNWKRRQESLPAALSTAFLAFIIYFSGLSAALFPALAAALVASCSAFGNEMQLRLPFTLPFLGGELL